MKFKKYFVKWKDYIYEEEKTSGKTYTDRNLCEYIPNTIGTSNSKVFHFKLGGENNHSSKS